MGELASRQGASILGKRRSSQSCKTAPIWRSVLGQTQGGHINEIQVRIIFVNLPQRGYFSFDHMFQHLPFETRSKRILILLPLKNDFTLTSVFIEIKCKQQPLGSIIEHHPRSDRTLCAVGGLTWSSI